MRKQVFLSIRIFLPSFKYKIRCLVGCIYSWAGVKKKGGKKPIEFDRTTMNLLLFVSIVAVTLHPGVFSFLFPVENFFLARLKWGLAVRGVFSNLKIVKYYYNREDFSSDDDEFE